MIASMVDTRYEKAAWVLVVLNGLLGLLFFSYLLVSGNTYFFVTGTGYPASALSDLAFAARLEGALGLVGGVLQVGLSVRPFRRGEKWAWLALWIIPLFGLLNSYLDYLDAGLFFQTVLISFIFLSGLTTIALLLTIRKFFPRK